jgi:hypothetical protein
MQRIVNLQLRQERNALTFFGPVAKSRARFEVHGEVRFVSDLIAYHSSADAGTSRSGAPHGAWLWPSLPFRSLFVLI